MQWVATHCGLPGNERADALAREASALPQHETRIDTGTVQKAVATSEVCYRYMAEELA